jgi:hypothetical protein
MIKEKIFGGSKILKINKIGSILEPILLMF